MSHFRKSPIRFARHGSSQPANPARSPSQPIDSNDNLDKRQKHKSSRITSSHQATVAPNPSSNLFDDHLEKETDSSSHSSYSWSSRNRYKNDFRDSGGLQSQTVEELENYAAYKAEETTNAVNNCLKIAEDMREDATNTLVALHHQGEQITRTHMVTADIDNDLSRGEKLLGSLGGIFSKTWKPKKGRQITGPIIFEGDQAVISKGNHLEQRERLGLSRAPNPRSSRAPHPEPTNSLQKVEVEKVKQEDALSDLSNILGELKGMAVDMGTELDRQNKALDNLFDDADEITVRVDNANRRARHLLRK
ncbi:putative SNAP25 homologous protein SNAP30 [Cucurbita pepo subsp. pepo]|uniref:putative SNAP25 homologous protein SNAP30 n=1 Tax=Cucurbita pepo subsp. pepo TaxID=3664 RepID=UPI000C9D61B7|nr:putative SNAP25 homologous protein SNAP30 [Cucurbita pepo subsp. pepo]XP_023516515.1 putative SNAP25 homologous protein SNAP30 [Cucurbita pepo subsp. pepo]XP_023516516.1 putative SNAP25 homologous protein SNAP30 [Cucurbita pepo subsp. pepo]